MAGLSPLASKALPRGLYLYETGVYLESSGQGQVKKKKKKKKNGPMFFLCA